MDIMGMDAMEQQLVNGHDGSSIDPGKIFVGGLSWQTTNDSLRQYFSQFGDVIDCMVMKDQATKRSRGFGFVVFADPSSVDKVLASGPHDIDAKRVDPKKSFPRPKLADGQSKDGLGILDSNGMGKLVTRTKKMFVGGLSSSTTVEDVKSYFEQFGKVEDAMLMYDKQTQRHRGFAFVTFEKEDTVDKVVDLHYHDINNKTVECKKAQPKALMDPATAVKGVIPVSLTPVLATTCARAGFPITGLPQYYYGLPYGYLTANAATLSGSDRLLAAAAAAAAASAGNATYFTTTPAGGDFQTQSATIGSSLSRTMAASTSSLSTAIGGCAPPMSPPMQQQQVRAGMLDQYVVQRMLQGQTASGQTPGIGSGSTAPNTASRALLTLQDYATAGDFTLVNGYTSTAGLPFSPLSPVHNGHSFTQTNGPNTLFQLGMPTAAFPAAALTGIHGSYQ